jgi:hypothetical protein
LNAPEPGLFPGQKRPSRWRDVRDSKGKSFLVLFFKKELSFFLHTVEIINFI